MTPKAMLDQCEQLDIKRKKKIKEDYIELVFYAKDVKQWNGLLADQLGPPVKPAFQKPSGEDRKLTQKLGGIRPNQTLFKKNIQGANLIAMLWPWKDKKHITLKVYFP